MSASRLCSNLVNAPRATLEPHALTLCAQDGARAAGEPLTALALLGALLLALGCAAPPHQRGAPLTLRPPPQMPRSSVAAVLAHGHELDLAREQAQALRSIDEQLAREQEAIRGPQRETATARPGGEHSGHRGGGQERAAPKTATDTEQIWDDNDTEAYLAAEGVLRADQRDRARGIAEAYREQLYEFRAAGKRAKAQEVEGRGSSDHR